MNTIAKTLSDRALRLETWLYAALFIAANVLLPQLFHLLGLGGAIFIPILFFTLLAAVRYGAVCAVVTATLSPLVSFALTGMPVAPVMWVLMIKGVAMAGAASLLIKPEQTIRLWQVAVVALTAQLVGMAAQGLFFGGFALAWSAVMIAMPGIAIQIAGVWAVCKLPRK